MQITYSDLDKLLDWIPLEKEIPPNGKLVIVRNEHTGQIAIYLKDGRPNKAWSTRAGYIAKITHWRYFLKEDILELIRKNYGYTNFHGRDNSLG